MTKKKPGKTSPTRKVARKSPATANSATSKPAASKPVASVKRAAKPAKDVAKITLSKTLAGKTTTSKTTASKRAPPPVGDPLDAFIAAAAAALMLPVEPQWLPAIKANLDVTLRLGAQVTEFELADEAEPAPVFGA